MWKLTDTPISTGVMVNRMDGFTALIEFPADDADRARKFWSGLLGVELADRPAGQGRGWQTTEGVGLGLHEGGVGPGDTASLPYFTVPDMDVALGRVAELGGRIIHPGSQWSVCRDSEGSPFGLSLGAL